jgi:hypothetical protein
VSRRWAFGFLAWAALAFTVAYWDYDENQRLAGAPTAPAVITDIIRWSKGGPYLELRIELPDGGTVQASTNQFYDVPQLRKGGRIVVQYDIDGRDVCTPGRRVSDQTTRASGAGRSPGSELP